MQLVRGYSVSASLGNIPVNVHIERIVGITNSDDRTITYLTMLQGGQITFELSQEEVEDLNRVALHLVSHMAEAEQSPQIQGLSAKTQEWQMLRTEDGKSFLSSDSKGPSLTLNGTPIHFEYTVLAKFARELKAHVDNVRSAPVPVIS